MNRVSGPDGRLAVCAAAATMLTALSLTPLVETLIWSAGALLVVLSVMVSGIVLRQTVNLRVAAPLGQALVLVLVLVLLFTRDRLFDPVGAVRGLVELAGAGLEVSREQAAPVDAEPGVAFLLVGGAGLVALLTDVLATTFRQTALAGLPLLGLYCVPAALLPGGLPWYLFVLGALAFLALLAADAEDRMLSWGRVLGGSGRTGPAGAPPQLGSYLGQGGRRAAAVAVVAALVVPAVTPGLNDQLFGSGGIGAGSSGSGTITRINPIVTLRDDLTARQDTELLTYRTNSAAPEPLRVVTADVFDGETWQPGRPRIPRSNRVQDGLPDPPGLAPGVPARTVTTQIDIGRLRETYLPLPYPASAVSIDGEWLYDADTLNVIGDGVDTRGIRYTVRHLQVTPTARQLATAAAGRGVVSSTYVALPGNLPATIATQARQVGGTGSAYQQAVNLQRWFRTEFAYSTQAPRAQGQDSGSSALSQFLVVKRGYCVHFASAMAVMARALGIPARVAIGFLPGERGPDGTMTISAHDAHAWPELYFSGIGWVRFEPTPRTVDGLAPPPWTQPSSDALPQDTTSTSTQSLPPSSEAATPGADDSSQAAEDALAADARAGVGLPPILVLLFALLAAVAALPWAAARVAAARRWRAAERVVGPDRTRARAEAAWADLRAGLADVGVRWARSWTPRAAMQRIITEHEPSGPAGAALHRLVDDIEGARYARPGSVPDRPSTARREDVRAVLAAVTQTRSRAVQVRARALPASGVEVVRGGLQRCGDAWARFADRWVAGAGRGRGWDEDLGSPAEGKLRQKAER